MRGTCARPCVPLRKSRRGAIVAGEAASRSVYDGKWRRYTSSLSPSAKNLSLLSLPFLPLAVASSLLCPSQLCVCSSPSLSFLVLCPPCFWFPGFPRCPGQRGGRPIPPLLLLTLVPFPSSPRRSRLFLTLNSLPLALSIRRTRAARSIWSLFPGRIRIRVARVIRREK